ncbi:acyl carrier protein [Rhodovulum tesquicola]|uniref:acyl carrier protein n=1 Tax=Rhodovulum tesquicola TaxID=540254 RepID=UPI0020973AFC|nr:acyl carrier protein [Rhodovulum tesquicola]MCO8145492.1 acyl carrier protein [Rhodovulum tesquicola]
MTEDEIRAAYLTALTSVAPDIEAEAIGPDDHLQEDLELDSMDVLNLVAVLQKALGVDIPERDCPQIATLALAVGYLGRRLAG